MGVSMKHIRSLLVAAAAASLTAALPAYAATGVAPGAPQASIPFVDQGSIRDWRAVGDHMLYVQDIQNRWYRASLMGPCIDLPFTETIGFDARGTNRFDRFSSIHVRGKDCALTSLVASGPPPKKAKHKP